MFPRDQIGPQRDHEQNSQNTAEERDYTRALSLSRLDANVGGGKFTGSGSVLLSGASVREIDLEGRAEFIIYLGDRVERRGFTPWLVSH